MEPKVSIIITTTGERPLELARAVQSVKDQTFKDFELIVYEDTKREGAAIARNKGFQASHGKYVVYLDDDNELLPDFLKETVYLLENSPKECGGVRVGRIIKQQGFTDYAPPYTHTGFESIDWGFLMKREVLENIHYDTEMYADEDADFGIQYGKLYQTIPIDKPLQIAHAESDEGSMCAPSERRLKGLEAFIRKNLEWYKRDKNELRYLYRLAGRNFYRAGQRRKGISYFWKSFLARKNIKTFIHFFFILFGWNAYNWYMDHEERKGANTRIQQYGI